MCNTVDSVRIPLTSDANSFRESEKDKDGRVERVNGKSKSFIRSQGKKSNSFFSH